MQLKEHEQREQKRKEDKVLKSVATHYGRDQFASIFAILVIENVESLYVFSFLLLMFIPYVFLISHD